MKILTKKKQDEILKRLVANNIIYLEGNGDAECIEKFADNGAEIAFLVGGIKGAEKMFNTVHNRIMAKMGEREHGRMFWLRKNRH